ncbi:hypothetical protein CARUB_v10015201mg [Capsella rubella]|uniref:Uncharacterized protein n=1 Tax=Capsella rubella TaxID=81985 RepID=R0HQC8_9BRAS|nr:uncharacterized protein LOC17893229 [Capsella rubella]EOA31959.1 hypothetical protein CARUB_v10015201mg [Capsella rubella]
MNIKFIMIASLLLILIASSNSSIIPTSKNRKIIDEEVEGGEKIHIHKIKKITVRASRSPPAKGVKSYPTKSKLQ